jgi:hypothetical protein
VLPELPPLPLEEPLPVDPLPEVLLPLDEVPLLDPLPEPPPPLDDPLLPPDVLPELPPVEEVEPEPLLEVLELPPLLGVPERHTETIDDAPLGVTDSQVPPEQACVESQNERHDPW